MEKFFAPSLSFINCLEDSEIFENYSNILGKIWLQLEREKKRHVEYIRSLIFVSSVISQNRINLASYLEIRPLSYEEEELQSLQF